MSAFKALRDVSTNFENDLRHVSAKLCSASIGEKFEDDLAKKLRDVKLFSSKLKLLRAKPLALTPHVTEQPHNNALEEYGETATWKVLEQLTVKSITQSHAVKALITKSNRSLDPDLLKRKEAIMESLTQFSQKESQLSHLDALLKEREAELTALIMKWDNIVGKLRETHDQLNVSNSGNRGPLYPKLNQLVDKLEVMRWLIARLVCARGNYDWLADPHRRLSALGMTRTRNTVDLFTPDQ